MLEKDVLLSKISIIKNCLQRIKTVTKLKPETLDDFTNQDVFILNLQRAIQAAIDIANLIISQNNYRLPTSYKMSFLILFENDWVDAETAERMQKMVGFRNIAIHNYQEIDTEVLKSILTKDLSDLEKFYLQILARVNAQN
jgi:uncharacterized protein YutE (UPF0331/DUF86 family)